MMEYPHQMFLSQLRIFKSNIYNYNKNKIKTMTIIDQSRVNNEENSPVDLH